VSTKIHEITKVDDNHVQKGVNESIQFLKNSTIDASAIVTIVVGKAGTASWSYTHLGGLSKLAIIGGLEAFKRDLLKDM